MRLSVPGDEKTGAERKPFRRPSHGKETEKKPRGPTAAFSLPYFLRTETFFPLQRPGAYYARATPVPIPNTEVKPRRAHGTAGTPVGESVSAGTLERKKE